MIRVWERRREEVFVGRSPYSVCYDLSEAIVTHHSASMTRPNSNPPKINGHGKKTCTPAATHRHAHHRAHHTTDSEPRTNHHPQPKSRPPQRPAAPHIHARGLHLAASRFHHRQTLQPILPSSYTNSTLLLHGPPTGAGGR